MLDFDLNEPLMKEENDEQDDEPFIGQTFESEDETFFFYNNYAKQHGFFVRKDRSDKRNGRTIGRDILCHHARKQRLKVADHFKPQRTKKSSNCDCKACMCLTLKRIFDVFLKSGMLQNLSICTIMHCELSFIDKDVRNLFYRVKRILRANDAKDLTFVSIMKKSSKTIITDQDPWVTQAIATEIPTTKHSSFYKMSVPEDFEYNWTLMVVKFKLQDNMNINGLYNIKYFWAPAYFRDNFFGGMISTGESGSINAFINRFVSSHTCLTDFVKHVCGFWSLIN
ncbi:hypothetical protein GQ457_01G016250 [Hibiscus cannabinus]